MFPKRTEDVRGEADGAKKCDSEDYCRNDENLGVVGADSTGKVGLLADEYCFGVSQGLTATDNERGWGLGGYIVP